MTEAAVSELWSRLNTQFDLDNKPFKPEELLAGEEFWRDRQEWLAERGYMLRSRFRPGWVPSWTQNGKRWEQCEDRPRLKYTHLLDATRTSDNSLVMLKRVKTDIHPFEPDIAQFFGTGDIASEPQNHCVPVLETLHPPNTDDSVILVMPFLRSYNDPPFESIGDVVNFLRQVFEGLAFMHQQNVAHRDCSGNNIMLDPSDLFPTPFHPVETNKTQSLRKNVKHYSRSQRPAKYYLVDFGISRQYTAEERPPSEPIIQGADKSPPEHQGSALACDPFPTDLYYVGNMARTELLGNYKGLAFLQELVDSMVLVDPAARPSAEEVVESFNKISAHLTERQKAARLARRSESMFEGLFRDLMYVAHGYLMRLSPPPAPRVVKKD